MQRLRRGQLRRQRRGNAPQWLQLRRRASLRLSVDAFGSSREFNPVESIHGANGRTCPDNGSSDNVCTDNVTANLTANDGSSKHAWPDGDSHGAAGNRAEDSNALGSERAAYSSPVEAGRQNKRDLGCLDRGVTKHPDFVFRLRPEEVRATSPPRAAHSIRVSHPSRRVRGR
jgi:hypothetical protein